MDLAFLRPAEPKTGFAAAEEAVLCVYRAAVRMLEFRNECCGGGYDLAEMAGVAARAEGGTFSAALLTRTQAGLRLGNLLATSLSESTLKKAVSAIDKLRLFASILVPGPGVGRETAVFFVPAYEASMQVPREAIRIVLNTLEQLLAPRLGDASGLEVIVVLPERTLSPDAKRAVNETLRASFPRAGVFTEGALLTPPTEDAYYPGYRVLAPGEVAALLAPETGLARAMFPKRSRADAAIAYLGAPPGSFVVAHEVAVVPGQSDVAEVYRV